MGVAKSALWIISATLFPFYLFYSTHGQPSRVYIDNRGTASSWKNNQSGSLDDDYIYFYSGVEKVRIILLREVDSISHFPKFACGFLSELNSSCDSSLFAIFTLTPLGDYSPLIETRVVWSSNRNWRVGCNATLLLTGDGDLILKDDDGSTVWSTNTRNKSVAGLTLTDTGNLVLFDSKNSTVWQSFDHPTDTLLLGQKLYSGQKLTSNNSPTNSSQGLYSFFLTKGILSAFIESDPSLVYFRDSEIKQSSYVKFSGGNFALDTKDSNDPLPNSVRMRHVRLDFDGHLRVYDWVDFSWKVVEDILTSSIGDCGYPLVCGAYGICSTGGEDGNPLCSCPKVTSDNTNLSYFEQIIERYPDHGCYEINPLFCNRSKSQKLVELTNGSHLIGHPNIVDIDEKSCKQYCLNNCSCKAVLFKEQKCYMISQVLSLINIESNWNDDIFLKVQDNSRSPISSSSRSKTSKNIIILGWSLGAISGFFLIIGVIIFLSRKKAYAADLEEDCLDHVPGMPKRYSYEDLIAKTNNFSEKLGQGGFGSVFEGTLSNGTIVAVKCLDGLGQIKESFLSEVKTIGSIHHVNLVRLIGYCNNKSHRLLVYEYMSNGSLDKWIFRGSQDSALDWNTRRMIILDIAKGLAYLHDGCSQKILHLDIKPQNILLGKNFQAKLSDFGLSKLIDRDQSQVVTMMKGTPGYMAPEWLNSVITEKVDVYSFGVVVLEILCGRRNLDRSQPEEDMHLLSVFKRKAEEDQLLDMIDKNSEDMLSNGAKVIEMMKVAAWCLQGDFTKRPSMSVVVKVLEGSPDVEENLEYDFTFPPVSRGNLTPETKNGGSKVTTPILPSILSGPR